MMDFSNFTQDEIQEARSYVADRARLHARAMLQDDYGWASHITQDWKEMRSREELEFADDVERGEYDYNLTVAQSMYYFLTGESVAILGV